MRVVVGSSGSAWVADDRLGRVGARVRPRDPFRSYRDANAEIYVMDADGTHQVNLTNSPTDDYSADWSPDGTRIVFDSSSNGERIARQAATIYVMNADGSGLVRLTDLDGSGSAVWRPVLQ